MSAVDTLLAAVREAKETCRVTDRFVDSMLETAEGRLRHGSKERLVALKRELTQFNAVTGRWKT